MREIPILFSTPMVQAILDDRKNMTRRVIKHYGKTPQDYARDRFYKTVDSLNNKPGLWAGFYKNSDIFEYEGEQHIDAIYFKCPYGQPGDRLWVRETWAGLPQFHNLNSEIERYIYKADEDATPLKWKPSIFMPKEAARIWLEVVSVRVGQLQKITEEDAIAEGFKDSWDLSNNRLFCTAKENFEGLWNTINGKRGFGWDVNPWVWVIEFKQLGVTEI